MKLIASCGTEWYRTEAVPEASQTEELKASLPPPRA